jgi:hypothetical protein
VFYVKIKIERSDCVNAKLVPRPAPSMAQGCQAIACSREVMRNVRLIFLRIYEKWLTKTNFNLGIGGDVNFAYVINKLAYVNIGTALNYHFGNVATIGTGTYYDEDGDREENYVVFVWTSSDGSSGWQHSSTARRRYEHRVSYSRRPVNQNPLL